MNGQIRRILLFNQLGRSADSGPSRQLVTNSSKYGLTVGSYAAEYLRLTEAGTKIVNPDTDPVERKKTEFELAIKGIEPFSKLYDRLKNKRVPSSDVLQDEVAQVGIRGEDRKQCAGIFIANIRTLGLVKELSGTDRLVPIEQALEELPSLAVSTPAQNRDGTPSESISTPTQAQKPTTDTIPSPSVHIDIQIHIDSSAAADQIDQIFASMARHLYNRPPQE